MLTPSLRLPAGAPTLSGTDTKKRNEQATKEFPDEPLRRLQKSLITAADVVAYIEANKFSKQTLCEKDLDDVLRVLVYDGKLECHKPEATPDDEAGGTGEAGVSRFRVRASAPVYGNTPGLTLYPFLLSSLSCLPLLSSSLPARALSFWPSLYSSILPPLSL